MPNRYTDQDGNTLGGSGLYTTPGTPGTPVDDDFSKQVTAWYDQLLGRTPSAEEIASHRGNPAGLEGVFGAIAASPELKAKGTAATGTQTTAGGSDRERLQALLTKYKSTDDLAYWEKIAAEHGGFDKTGADWLEDRIMRGDGAEGVRNGTVQRVQHGPSGGGFGDMNIQGGPATNTGQYPLASYFTNSPLMQPWTTPFTSPEYKGIGAYKTPDPFVPEKFTPAADYVPADPFKAPTEEEARNTPGYKFAADQGQKGLERSAAARGGLLTGGTLKDITDYRVGVADQNYQNVYKNAKDIYDTTETNRSGAYVTNANKNLGGFYANNSSGLAAYTANANTGLAGHQTNVQEDLNKWITNYQNSLNDYMRSYNIFEGNQAKQYNRLSDFSGGGQTAANQLGQSGYNYANLFGNTTTGTAGSLGDIYTGQGNATAAGQVGGANAWQNAFGNTANGLLGLYAGR